MHPVVQIEERLRKGPLGFLVITPESSADSASIMAAIASHLPPGAEAVEYAVWIHVFVPGAGFEEVQRMAVQLFEAVPELIRYVTGAAAKPGDEAELVPRAADVLTQVCGGRGVACTEVVKDGWYEREDYVVLRTPRQKRAPIPPGS